MADNVAITAGSGTTIGTDEVTIGAVLQHVQRVKLVDGADGGTALIGGDATNGLDVDVTRVTGTVAIAGDVASDAVDSGNPQKIGGIASTAIPTAMSADADRVGAWFDRNGAQLVKLRPASTSTLTNVASSATNVTVLAANTARLGATVFNDSTSSVYVKLGTTASATSFTLLMLPASYYEVPFGYTGIIDGIWVTAQGNARVTELTS